MSKKGAQQIQSNAPAPDGSCWIKLADILLRFEAGKSFKCLTRPAYPHEWGVIKVSAMTWGKFDESENKAVPPNQQFDPSNEIQPDDLLLSRSNTPELVGASVLVPHCRSRLLLSDKSLRLVVSREIHRGWLWRILLSPNVRGQFTATATGTSNSMRNVSQEKVRNVQLILPPRGEQERISEKVDELFSDLDAGVAALERAKANLKRYRAAVLKAAVEGRLTQEWRSAHPDVEPASELLKRILTERRCKWEADKLAEYEAKGTPPPKNWKDKYKEPVGPDTKALSKLPEGWCWSSLQQLAEIGTGTTPKRGTARFYEGGTIPWVTSTAVNQSNVFAGTEFVTETAVNETNLRLYPPHTLIVALYGEGKTRGKVSELQIDATINQALGALVFYGISSDIRPYVKTFLEANYVNLRRKAAGGMQPNLNLGLLSETPVALPPLDEQRVSVDEVEARFSIQSAISEQLHANLQRCRRLRQSILKRAFEGQLVAQSRDDEPATALLDRTRQQRSTGETNGKPGKREARQSKKTVRATK